MFRDINFKVFKKLLTKSKLTSIVNNVTMCEKQSKFFVK